MKSFFSIFFLLLIGPFCYAQHVYQIKADSVRIYNTCDTAELILENRTQTVPGFLFNKGNGRTEFQKLKLISPGVGSLSILGQDTINLPNVLSPWSDGRYDLLSTNFVTIQPGDSMLWSQWYANKTIGYFAYGSPDMPALSSQAFQGAGTNSYYNGLVMKTGTTGFDFAVNWNGELMGPNGAFIRIKDDTKDQWSKWRELLFKDYADKSYILNQKSSPQTADLWINGAAKIGDSVVLSRYRNNVAGDSVLTTDANGILKLKYSGVSAIANGGNGISIENDTAKWKGRLSDSTMIQTAGNWMQFRKEGATDTAAFNFGRFKIYNTYEQAGNEMWFKDSGNVTTSFSQTAAGTVLSSLSADNITKSTKALVGPSGVGFYTKGSMGFEVSVLQNDVGSAQKNRLKLDGGPDGYPTTAALYHYPNTASDIYAGTSLQLSDRSWGMGGTHAGIGGSDSSANITVLGNDHAHPKVYINYDQINTTSWMDADTTPVQIGSSRLYDPSTVGTGNPADVRFDTSSRTLKVWGRTVGRPAQRYDEYPTLQQVTDSMNFRTSGFIKNGTTQQTGASFNISGNGQVARMGIGMAPTNFPSPFYLNVGGWARFGGSGSGYTAFCPGTGGGVATGSILFYKSDNTLWGTIYGDTANVVYSAPTGATHLFTGGSVRVNNSLAVLGSVSTAITTVIANTTLDNTYNTILVNNSGAITITLPTAASAFSNGAGRRYTIKKISGASNNVSIQPSGPELLDGSNASKVLTLQNSSVTVQSDGTSWNIISSYASATTL